MPNVLCGFLSSLQPLLTEHSATSTMTQEEDAISVVQQKVSKGAKRHPEPISHVGSDTKILQCKPKFAVRLILSTSMTPFRFHITEHAVRYRPHLLRGKRFKSARSVKQTL
jgi:hypothetical protein